MALLGVISHLTWHHYRKVKTSPDPPNDAQTGPVISSGFEVVPEKKKWKTKNVRVTLKLDHDDTWVVAGQEDNDLLAHEEGHYSIWVIGARTLHNRLNAIEGDSEDDVKQQAKEINEAILGRDGDDDSGQLAQINKIYEDDPNCGTDHGTRKGNQTVWSHQIKRIRASSDGTLDALTVCPKP